MSVCTLQGASEDAPPKKEKLEKGNENYQKVKEVSRHVFLQEVVFYLLVFVVVFLLPTDHLSILNVGLAVMSVFVDEEFYVVLRLSLFRNGGFFTAEFITFYYYFPLIVSLDYSCCKRLKCE